MQTLTRQKQPSAKQQGRKRQKAQQQKANNPKQGENQEQPQQEEGLYRLVKEEEALRARHTAKLQDTPGYSHLTVEEAGGMVEQMLRLSCLMYEMLREPGQNPLEEQRSPEKTAAAESKQNQTRQQQLRR